MTHRPIIDAGPGLNFLSINKERLLIGVLGRLSAPDTVQREVLRKARRDERFRAAAGVWRKLTPVWIEVLSDDETPELAAVIHRMTRQSMEQRLQRPHDLGETMVIAHAVVAAEAGAAVTVLIDDGAGARAATLELNRLRRLRANSRAVGSIRLVNTLTVLEAAANTSHIPDKHAMRTTYNRLRGLDDGLPPIDKTNLLISPRWE
jgi:hypothetical protein